MGSGEQVAHRVDAAALPGGALETTPDRSEGSGIGSAAHELHAGQAAVGEIGEELTPERPALRVANIDPEDLTVTVSAEPRRDHHRLGHDVAVLADMHVGGVQPDVDERLMIEA